MEELNLTGEECATRQLLHWNTKKEISIQNSGFSTEMAGWPEAEITASGQNSSILQQNTIILIF